MKKVDARNSGASGKRSDKGVSSSSRQLSVRNDTGAKLQPAAKTAKSSSAKALPAAKKADADLVPSNEFDYSLLEAAVGDYAQIPCIYVAREGDVG